MWQPQLVDLLPVNEPTTSTLIDSATSVTTNDSANFTIDVVRPDLTPVVTGNVRFVSADSLAKIGLQKAIRSASGRWTLKISDLEAGIYVGYIEYFDTTNTHAGNLIPISFEVTQGPAPTPSPAPTKRPAPKPVDACAGQIRN